ncbi:nuclease-related domain-containing protein [Mesobacillus subterraneus]|uniref:NERD domain-containing protein n=1 Tax=Mesobacillus subterraneus TaxID=285983 RepID=A0A3R9E768_9BACI|nr:nuclease-related domain-containing protein [Mesobacillus subterraneus]RSD25539.1 NERD domain-containing protein [Mesobacillus subterraneus]
MIRKERGYPIRLRMYETILKRIVDHHLKLQQIEQDYNGWRSGYKGELKTDYRLSFLPEKGYDIFRDLRLPDGTWYFQMDTLILTLRYILLIETKNHSGTLFFDKESQQMIQTKDEKEKAYECPVLQVKMQSWHLRRWMIEHKFAIPPIFHLVVISNPNTIIKSNNPQLYNTVVKGDVLLNRVQQIDQKNSKEVFTAKELKKLSNMLLKKHTPQHPDLLKFYSLTDEDFHKGVECPACSSFGMFREKWHWMCPHCGHTSKSAHYGAIMDHFLLYKPTMTNQEFRDIAKIDSLKSANRMLSFMNLPATGINKGRIYHMPADIDTFFTFPKI